MSVKLINSGNGDIVDGSLINYTYSEDVTSLQPGDSRGGTGQVTVRAIELTADKVGETHPNSKLLINNSVTLIDDVFGTVEFNVKKVSTSGGAVTITGDTAQSRLNVIKTAGPHGGDGATIATAISYYCGLVGILPTIEPTLEAELDAISVNYIGWTGNVWEHLKMLCAVVSSSETATSPIEMYIDTTGLYFRKALNRVNANDDLMSELSVNVDSFEASKSVGVYNYNTSYGVDKVVYDISNYEDGADKSKTFLASIADSLQVDAGATVVKRFTIDATLEYVNNPVCVDLIDRVYPLPYLGTTGQYVVVGTDGLPILPAQWNDLGGSLTIALTENPNEIEVTITAPPVPQLDRASGGVGYAPYKIGVEEADGTDYPAFWVTGTGVFYNKKLTQFGTGASDSYTSNDNAPTIDNPFITNGNTVSAAGVAAAQAACGPRIDYTSAMPTADGFGQLIGSTQIVGSNKMRINSAAFSESGVSISGSSCATISEFNAKWSGLTFDDFTSIAIDGSVGAPNIEQALKFNEFTVIPLMEAQ